MKTTSLLIGLMFLLKLSVPVSADEKLEGIACRSVHLSYPAKKGQTFRNEVTVRESAPGTFFMVCGWDQGYFGLQELANGKKLILFSVWDSNQNDPDAVEGTQRTRVLLKSEAVRIGRFGGEGTGGQAFLDYDWKTGVTYQFQVLGKVNGDRTEYAGSFIDPETKMSKHIVTFSTVTGGKPLSGYYSFIEDFKRDRVSTTKVRRAEFGNGWVRPVDEFQWQPLIHARFTADDNPVTNINAGVTEGRFFLATGGDTKNTDTKLNEKLQLPKDPNRTTPRDLVR